MSNFRVGESSSMTKTIASVLAIKKSPVTWI